MLDFGHDEPLDVARIQLGMGNGDPGSDVVRGNVDATRTVETGRDQETVQVAGGGVEIVAAHRLVAVTHAARIEHDDLAPRLDEQGDDLAPRNPALRPAGDQDDRLAFARSHIVKAQSVHLDGVMDDIAERRMRRLRQSRTCGAESGRQDKRSKQAHGKIPSRIQIFRLRANFRISAYEIRSPVP